MHIVIVHFNTPELTTAAVRSIWKNAPGCKVSVFDNSDKRPFPKMDGVCLLDNTKGQLIDFKKFLDEFPEKQDLTINNWGSAKHCKTIDYLWDMFPSGFFLMDADALLKRDISGLPDENKAFVGEVFQDIRVPEFIVPRVLPYFCWINVTLCRKAGFRYFDPNRNWKIYPGDFSTWYDTGGSFYEDCLNSHLRYKEIKLDDYIEHFGGATYHQEKSQGEWLEKFRYLYE